MNKEHVLICIMAESAAGKDKMADTLCQRNNWKQLISYTTRPRRTNEGDTHIFSSREEYDAAVLKFSTPFIVKPADNSGSRGIVKIENFGHAENI